MGYLSDHFGRENLMLVVFGGEALALLGLVFWGRQPLGFMFFAAMTFACWGEIFSLFPSMCEGFGLPPLEAMRFGKPVFLSRLTSLPEVGGKYAFYWDELEPEAMAAVVKKGLDEWRVSGSPDEVRRWSCRFSWEKCASDYVRLYLDMLGD